MGSTTGSDDHYWRTQVSSLTDEKVSIRGYDLESLIGNLSFTSAIYLLIRGRLPTPPQVRVLDAVLSAVLDYGLEKPGTVAARFAVSANPSMAVGLAAACMSVGSNTLATDDTARFAIVTHDRYLRSGLALDAFATEEVARLRSAGQRIPGLGHPVFKREDPRGAALKRVAVEEGCWPDAAATYEAVHRAFASLPGKQDIPINDVGVMAMVLVGLGFTPDEGTGLAILSTLPGVIAHVSEELTSGRRIRVIPRDTVAYQKPCTRDFTTDQQAARGGVDS